MTVAPYKLILASTSPIRSKMLRDAGLIFDTRAPRVDEENLVQALQAEGSAPRDIADALAEAKARRVSGQSGDAFVLGCDQTLELQGEMFFKPDTPQTAVAQLTRLQGQTHHLYSAAVLYHQGQPIWRHIGHARMAMRALSSAMIESYVAENWQSIQNAVGCYKIEEKGVQLFSAIEGDNFVIQGMPLIPLLTYLAVRGMIAS